MIALVLPTAATGDLVVAIQQAASQEVMSRVPLAAVLLDQPESVRLIPRAEGDGQLPAYWYPEAAAAGCLRTRPPNCCAVTASRWPGSAPAGSEDEAISATEVIVGVADDHMFGSLVLFGLGGVAPRSSPTSRPGSRR